MIARLILSLLLAAFALPVTAATPCHDAPAASMSGMQHEMPAPSQHDDKAVAAHSCIGCIPPSTMQPRALGTPLLADDADRITTITDFDRGPETPPATPPPRRSA